MERVTEFVRTQWPKVILILAIGIPIWIGLSATSAVEVAVEYLDPNIIADNLIDEIEVDDGDGGLKTIPIETRLRPGAELLLNLIRLGIPMLIGWVLVYRTDLGSVASKGWEILSNWVEVKYDESYDPGDDEDDVPAKLAAAYRAGDQDLIALFTKRLNDPIVKK